MRSATLVHELAELLAGRGIGEPAREAAQIARAAGGDRDHALSMVDRRLAGAPLGSVTGRVRFLGLALDVAPGVLVPRAETELLARSVIEWLRRRPGGARVVDMCAGAGNLACAIAHHVPDAHVWASDCSEAAVALARQNARALGLSARVHVACGDLFAPLRGLGLEGRVDALVCNPPYISTSRLEGVSRALTRHEPREAFDGGPFGLAIQQRVAREGAELVRAGGLLAMEFGAGQQRQIEALLRRARAWNTPAVIADPEGEPRVVFTLRRNVA